MKLYEKRGREVKRSGRFGVFVWFTTCEAVHTGLFLLASVLTSQLARVGVGAPVLGRAQQGIKGLV